MPSKKLNQGLQKNYYITIRDFKINRNNYDFKKYFKFINNILPFLLSKFLSYTIFLKIFNQDFN